MNNEPIINKEGKEVWISRSVSVSGLIVFYDREKNNVYFLMERRGPGCPDFIGKLSDVCGYLDYNETLKEALIRETKEEIGIDISNKDIYMWEVIDDPKNNERQNIIFRYIVLYSEDINVAKEIIDNFRDESELRGGEKGEVSELVLVNYDDLYNIGKEEFAFSCFEFLNEFGEEFLNL